MDMWLSTIAIIAGQRVTDWLTWSCWSSTSLSIDYSHGWEWRWSVGLVWLALRWMIFLGAVASAAFGYKTKARKRLKAGKRNSSGEMMNRILALGWPIDYYHHLQSPLHRSLFECRCVFPISHLASSFAPLSLSVAAVRMAGICVVNLLWYAEVSAWDTGDYYFKQPATTTHRRLFMLMLCFKVEEVPPEKFPRFRAF